LTVLQLAKPIKRGGASVGRAVFCVGGGGKQIGMGGVHNGRLHTHTKIRASEKNPKSAKEIFVYLFATPQSDGARGLAVVDESSRVSSVSTLANAWGTCSFHAHRVVSSSSRRGASALLVLFWFFGFFSASGFAIVSLPPPPKTSRAAGGLTACPDTRAVRRYKWEGPIVSGC
jgi:hypothetical protein